MKAPYPPMDVPAINVFSRMCASPKTSARYCGSSSVKFNLFQVTDDLRLRSGLREFAAGCRSVPRPVVREFERVVRQKAHVHRRILLWDRVHELFHYWHVLHKPFALVMYLFMIVHVAVALVTGYGWAGRS